MQFLNICKIRSSFLFQTAAALGFFFFFLWLTYLLIPVPPTIREKGEEKQYNFSSKVLFNWLLVDYSWAFLLDCVLEKFKYGAVLFGPIRVGSWTAVALHTFAFILKFWNQPCLDFFSFLFLFLLNCCVQYIEGGWGQGLFHNVFVCGCV